MHENIEIANKEFIKGRTRFEKFCAWLKLSEELAKFTVITHYHVIASICESESDSRICHKILKYQETVKFSILKKDAVKKEKKKHPAANV